MQILSAQDIEKNLPEISTTFDAIELSSDFSSKLSLAGEKKKGHDDSHLSELLKKLKAHKDLIVDQEHHTLADLQLCQVPARNKPCPCNSKQRYKKCCENKDIILRTKVMDDLEKRLKGKEGANGGLIYV